MAAQHAPNVSGNVAAALGGTQVELRCLAPSGDDEVTVTVTVNTDSREFILLGNGCSSTNGQPTDMLWLLVIGLVLGLRRRRQR